MGIMDTARRFFSGQKSANPPTTWPDDWFQLGMTPKAQGTGAVVEACVSAYAQTVAQLPPKHFKMLPDGQRELVRGSPVVRLLNRPNYYQTRADFFLNLVYGLLYHGNGYFIGQGGRVGMPEEVFLLDPSATHARRAYTDDGDVAIFYGSGGSFAEMLDPTSGHWSIPQRFVGHVKLHTPRDPLVGVTPIASALSSVSANQSITAHQASFFQNMARPSGVLSTEMDLSVEQMLKLRNAWETQSKNLNSGGVPILANGLGWTPLSISSQDSQTVEAWGMTIKDIARVFRVPPPLIGDLQNSTFNNAETLMRFWLASGLGSQIDMLEQVLTRFFRLPDNEFIELDHEVLLRTDLDARIKALGEGVQKGIFTPNEARLTEGKPPVEGGDDVFLQQQMTPISAPRDENQLGQQMLADVEGEPDDE